MLAVVKMPRTEDRLFSIDGSVPEDVLKYLNKKYDVEIVNSGDDGDVNAFETDWHKELSAEMQPGEAVAIYRKNHKWTQAKLGEKVGLSRQNICDIERGRRGVSKELAKEFSKLFHAALKNFI